MTPAVIPLIVDGGGCGFAITFVASSPACITTLAATFCYAVALQVQLPPDASSIRQPSMLAALVVIKLLQLCAIVDLHFRRPRTDDLWRAEYVVLFTALFYLLLCWG